MISGKKGILIIDHDPILGEFLQKYLAQHSYEPYVLMSSNHIPKILTSHTIDAVIIELELLCSKTNRFFWLAWLKEYYPHVKVFVFSIDTDKANRLLSLENGAEDFICKPFYNKEILLRLNNAMNIKKQRDFTKNVAIGNKIFNINDHVLIDENNNTIKLTTKEFDILRLLVRNQNKITSREDIKYHIDGAEFHPRDRSIDVHINKLRKKIEPDITDPIYIKTIRRKGYQLLLEQATPRLVA